MSIVLEGFVPDGDLTLWTGTWQFAKEKKTDLRFTYRWSTNVVGKDLYEYVSFIDEKTKELEAKKTNSITAAVVKKAKKGRGRPPVQLSPSDSSDACLAPDRISEAALDGDADGTQQADADDEENDVIAIQNACGQPTIESASSGALNPDIERVISRSSHPLLGVWEGSFNVKSGTKGLGEEEINETLFFHSILGDGENREKLPDLPPDPQFPYSVLRRDEIYGPDEANVWVHSIAKSQELKTRESNNNLTTSSLDNRMPSTVILVGFGRNVFGRFSAAALYDPKTGELRCEKKYMLTKIPVKRGRRSFAELAAEAVAAGGSYPAPGTSASDMLRGGSSHQQQRLAPKENSEVVSSSRVRHAPASYSYDDELVPKKKKTSSALGSSKDPKKDSSRTLGVTKTKLVDSSVVIPPPVVHGANALIGLKNPDNDEATSFYKEAFQDCDTGEIYEGGWAYGARHGFGICLHCDGLIYEGNWNVDREHGKGMLMTADRQIVYTGDWIDGAMTGNGSYFFGNGDKYIGDWKEGNRHGKGDYIFANGCRYSGDWRENKRCGRGLFVWPDQSYYEGDWDADMRHGRGYLELMNGFKYDGFWSCNQVDGKGKCTFPSGQSYEGTYKTGLREGRGSVTFAEGAVYEGRFKEDRFEGQGTVKVSETLPGSENDEVFIPIQIQSELWRIHLKAGFGSDTH